MEISRKRRMVQENSAGWRNEIEILEKAGKVHYIICQITQHLSNAQNGAGHFFAYYPPAGRSGLRLLWLAC